MLKVQEFLHTNGLQALIDTYKIKARINEDLGVVCLNYDQIASPVNFEIVQECRALILELNTWKVLSWPFKKFFNLGEAANIPANFDWDNFTAFDKLDGSLIHIWHHPKCGWHIGTRSVPDANTNVNDEGLLFRELVLMTLKDMKVSWDNLISFFEPGYSYSFELIGPENQIVVEYKERSLVMTGVRNVNTLQEVLPSQWVDEHPEFPLPFADEYHGWNKELAGSACLELNPREREGYVLVDKNWNRVKIKSEAYCYMSNKRDSLAKSAKSRLELILSEKDDDVLPILPVFVQKQVTDMKKALMELSDKIYKTYTSIMSIKEQKDFAEEAKKYNYSSFLFRLRKHPELLSDMFKTTTPSTILRLLNIQETDNIENDQ
jgi:hypothetical protein